MPPTREQLAAGRRLEQVERELAEDLVRLREEAGVSQRALSRASGIGQGHISRLESRKVRPSIETAARLGSALGTDLSIKLFPNTGPAVRDRHQARIVEALLALLSPRWIPFPEVGVRHPERGWIDLVLLDRSEPLVIATEVQSSLNRLEQLLRWALAKADSLPSAAAWPFGPPAAELPRIGRLLVIRETAATRTVAAAFERTIRAAYPADPELAHLALRGDVPWPGAAVLWATDRSHRGIELRARPAPSRRPGSTLC